MPNPWEKYQTGTQQGPWTQYSPQETKPKRDLVSRGLGALGGGLMGATEALVNIPGALYETGKAMAAPPASKEEVGMFALGGPAMLTTKRLALDPAREMFRRGTEAEEKGLPAAAAGYRAAGAVPLLGPYVAEKVERAVSGEAPEAIGSSLAEIGLMALGPKGVRKGTQAAKKAEMAALKGVSRGMGAPTGRMSRVAPGAAGEQGITNMEVLKFAQGKGIDLMPGQATQARPLQAMQSVGERGLFGKSVERLHNYLETQKRKLLSSFDEFSQRIGTPEEGLQKPPTTTAALLPETPGAALKPGQTPSSLARAQQELGRNMEAFESEIEATKKQLRGVERRRADGGPPEGTAERRIIGRRSGTPDAEAAGTAIQGPVKRLYEASKNRLESMKQDFQERVASAIEGISPETPDRLTIGTKLKESTSAALERAKAAAQADYEQSIGQVGKQKVDVRAVADKYASRLKDMAEALQNEPAEYSRPITALLSKASEFGRQGIRGSKFGEVKLPGAGSLDVNTLRQLRSDYLDMARDVSGTVPKQVNRLAAEIASDIDAILDTAAQKGGWSQQWRKANAGWKRLQETYNDPQSPLYRALQADDPSKAIQYLSSKAGGGSQQSVRILKENVPEAIPAVQRQVMQEIADSNFQMSKGKIGGYSEAYLKDLFGDEWITGLQEIAAEAKDLAGRKPSVDPLLRRIAESPEAAKVPQMITEKGFIGGSPERIRSIRLVSKEAGVDLLAPLKRQVFDDILNKNFSTVGNKLSGYSDAFLKELLTPAELRELKLFAETARRLRIEINPSGTSNILLGEEQVAAPIRAAVTKSTVPLAAQLLPKGLAARLSISPRFMEAVTGTTPRFVPGQYEPPFSLPRVGRRSSIESGFQYGAGAGLPSTLGRD